MLTGYRKWNSKPVPKPFKGGIYFGYKDMTDFLNDFNRINNKHGMLINCVCLGSGLFLMIMLAMFIIKISEVRNDELCFVCDFITAPLF